jgi:hypothetical protein
MTPASLMNSAGVPSSSTIVAVAAGRVMVAFVAADSASPTVSSGSCSVSSAVTTSIVFDVSPGLNVSVPLTGVKSAAPAVMPAVAKLTVIVDALAFESVTVNVAVSPSATL